MLLLFWLFTARPCLSISAMPSSVSGLVTCRYGSSLNVAETLFDVPSFLVKENVGRNRMLVIESGIHSILILAFQLSLRE